MNKIHPRILLRAALIPVLAACGIASVSAGTAEEPIVTNPINLNYRFQPGPDDVRREAADPVAEWFKDAYFMFASKCGGYWYSEDMKDWTYVPTTTIGAIEQYAPAILVMDDALYYISSGKPKIYRNTTPREDTWNEVENKFSYIADDIAAYLDDDGRLYFYWGCSDRKPIMGVEVDPKDGFAPIGEPVELILHRVDEFGWEVPGVNNEEKRQGWNEGPCMIKTDGKYLLQYAAPGTQYRVYGDGVYVADSPLGPFTYMENNPFSFKPGGFIGGAGHGHTFRDKFGNLWHVASMTIAQRHWFERRLGLFPVAINDAGEMYALTEWSDAPFVVPQRKVDFASYDPSVGWRLLSYGAEVSASSALDGHEPRKASDEQVETWWAAQSGNPGEWVGVDLGRKMKIRAIQPNFADHGFDVRPPHAPVAYKYHIEVSADGKEWKRVAERDADAPHELVVLDKPVDAHHVRVVNDRALDGSFSVFDLRVFGEAKGKAPAAVSGFKAVREEGDPRAFSFGWTPSEGADGYILRWGTAPDRLIHSAVIYADSYEARYFNRDSKYYFTLTPFNECGEGPTTETISTN